MLAPVAVLEPLAVREAPVSAGSAEPLTAVDAFAGQAVFTTQAAFATDVGRVRDENEDGCLVASDLGIFAVADGMGGHADGAFASATIVNALATVGVAVSATDLLARLENRILRANAALREAGRERAALVGSTVAVLLLFGENFACIWSGDSRIYRVRGAAITQITRDHTHVRDLLERGLITPAEARAWPQRNVITRALGVHDVPEMELEQGVVEAGDAFVLCSDGLTAHVEDPEILALAGAHAPRQACDALLALTLERGASDNVTVVVVRCAASHAPEAPAEGTLVPALHAGVGRGGSAR